MAKLTFLLLVSAVVCLLTPGIAGILSKPDDVHFELNVPHPLIWSPGNSTTEDISYEVEYSGNASEIWIPVRHCSPTFNLTCDLTVETLSEDEGYYARVRSVSGNQTSDWVQSDLYLFKEGDLPVPQNVHFNSDFFHHLLKWSPAIVNIENISYEVQYLKYGNRIWQPVPHCSPTSSNLTCDLTVETLPEAKGYFGSVRSVFRHRTSHWVRTDRYTSRDVTLSPPSVQLQVDGNSLIVQLRLPEIRKMNLTQRFEDVFPFNRVYTIYIRRTTDNYTFEQKEKNLHFHISDLFEGKEYCVSVQPSVASRGNVGTVSAETCVWLPRTKLGSNVLVVVASSILAVVAFMIFINIFICLYLRKSVKTPPTLKSLIKRSWSWMEKPPTPIAEGKISLHWENDFLAHLLSESKKSLMHSSADSGFGSQIFTEKCMLTIDPLSKHIEDDPRVSDPSGDVNTDKMTPIKDIQMGRQNSEIQGDDSGISLSTDSPYPRRSCSHKGSMHGDDIDSSGESGHHLLESEEVGYLKQQVPTENPMSAEDQDTQNIWQSEMIGYLKQSSKKLHHGNADFQEQCEGLPGPWSQLSEGFPSTVPLTPAFSPFSRVLLDLGVGPLSLGDIELMEGDS